MSYNLLDPFQRSLALYEAKLTLASTIRKLTKSKGRKYVKFCDLKSELNLDDSLFDDIIGNAKKSNRHSNKYIFTSIDDEPAIGITAAKRYRKDKSPTKEDQLPGTEPGHGLAHKVTMTPAYIHRENELWNMYHREGWRGLDRKDLLPENWQKMTDKESLFFVKFYSDSFVIFNSI